ncbi:hypothetical protein AB1Y20_016718 [Prymnesium parvum]|uniref:Glycosyl transferase family 25 domain-containing protein n=1 Tax=Prymnesium parvum TaxID=97485 RepID=A0AB34ID83_PRYPA
MEAAALAQWKAAKKERFKWRKAVDERRRREEDEALAAAASYARKADDVRRSAAAAAADAAAARRQLGEAELQVSEMRGRTQHLLSDQFAWEQDVREKAEKERQELLGERKLLLQQLARAQARKRVGELLTSGAVAPAAGQRAGAAAEAREWKELVLAINLDRRADRFARLSSLDWQQLDLERLSAVDGKTLQWDALVQDGIVAPEAAAEAWYAEEHHLPTICTKSGSFSPHLTLAAVGCALSHRRAWERISTQSACEWGLVLEDDVNQVAPDFADHLREVRSLPY